MLEFHEVEGLRVRIESVTYFPGLDAPEDRPHPFVYSIEIINHSPHEVTILGRKWIVNSGAKDVLVVEGEGVVGEQPVIPPGGKFSYRSYHVVAVDSVASGAFFGRDHEGKAIRVNIPEFALRVPKTG